MPSSFLSKLGLLLSVAGCAYSGLITTDPAAEYFSVAPGKYITWGKQNVQGKYDVWRYDTKAGCVRKLFTSGADFAGTVVTQYSYTYYLKSCDEYNCQLYRSHFPDQKGLTLPTPLLNDFATDYFNPVAFVGVQNARSTDADQNPKFYIWTLGTTTGNAIDFAAAPTPTPIALTGHEGAYVQRVRISVVTSLVGLVYEIFWLELGSSSCTIYAALYIPTTNTFLDIKSIYTSTTINDFFIESVLGTAVPTATPVSLIVAQDDYKFTINSLEVALDPFTITVEPLDGFNSAPTSTVLSMEVTPYFIYYAVSDTTRASGVTFIEKYDRSTKKADIDPAVKQPECGVVSGPAPQCQNLLDIVLSLNGIVTENGKTYQEYLAVLNYKNPLKLLQLALNIPTSALGLGSTGFTLLNSPDGSTLIPTGLLTPGTKVTLRLLVATGTPNIALTVIPTICLPAVGST